MPNREFTRPDVAGSTPFRIVPHCDCDRDETRVADRRVAVDGIGFLLGWDGHCGDSSQAGCDASGSLGKAPHPDRG
jgi:hypothetical protein